MTKFCKKCGKIMKKPQATHCSDECLLSEIKNSESFETRGAKSWKDESDPWI